MSKSLQYAAMVNYFNSLLAEDEPLSDDPGLLPAAEPEKAPALPFKEPETRASLQTLLDKVPATVETAAVPEVKEAVKTETVTATPVKTETRTEVKVQEAAPAVQVKTEEPQTAAVTEVRAEVKAEIPAPAPWRNMDLGKEFSALFFKVAGVLLAVPLKFRMTPAGWRRRSGHSKRFRRSASSSARKSWITSKS